MFLSRCEYQLRAVLFLIFFFSKTWETNQTFLYQYKCRSENLIQAFTPSFGVCGFFPPSGPSISYFKKCIMWIKEFSGMHATTSTIIGSYLSKCRFWRWKCSKSNLPSSLNFKASLYHDNSFSTYMSVLKSVSETLLHPSTCFVWMIKPL